MRKALLAFILGVAVVLSAGCAAGAGGGGLFASNVWPSDAVDGFPAPRTAHGKIVQVEENTYGAVVVYEGLSEEEVSQYVQDVKDYGFSTLQNEARTGDTYSYHARTMDRGASNVGIECMLGPFGKTTTTIDIYLDRSTR